jgi:L-fuconolactonase
MRIDAHQHFWQYSNSMDWITPDMSAIAKDFLPDDLAPLLEQERMDGTIAVQADQSVEETEFLLGLAEKNAFIKGVIGWADLRAEDISAQLSQYKQHSKLKGLRHVLQTEDPGFMLQTDFIRGIKALHASGLSYDLLVFPKHLKATLALVEQLPQQAFVIDHIAKPGIKGKMIDGWNEDITAIAKHENVYCKISGMVTEADWKGWKQADMIPYLDTVTEAFGTHRLMYGSDWPVCLLAASYGDVIGIVKKYFSTFTAAEQQEIFGDNASKFYHLS